MIVLAALIPLTLVALTLAFIRAMERATDPHPTARLPTLIHYDRGRATTTPKDLTRS